MSASKRLVWWVAVIVLLVGLGPLQKAIERERAYKQYNEPLPIEKMESFDPEGITGMVAVAILGGARGIAADLLWLKMDQYWHTGETWRVVQILRTVCHLDPHFVEAWDTAGWHYMYNMTVETNDPVQKQKYLDTGIAIYKEGIAWNPDKYDLYWELGWKNFDKMDDYQEAINWMCKAIRFPHPQFIERDIAHAYERMPDIPRALDWYDLCLKRDPHDHTARGATITIRERYLPAWRLYEEGRYQEALNSLEEHLAADPLDTIGLHMKATILDKMGQPQRALAVWQFVAENQALNKLARRKVVELQRRLGLPVTELPDVSGQALHRELERRQQEEAATGRSR